MKKYFVGFLTLVMTVAFALASVAVAGGDAANGEKLFNDKKKKCKICHKLTEKKKVGPGLKGVTKKRSEAWLIKWMTNSQKTWEENDAETQEMKKWPTMYGKKSRDGKPKTKMKGYGKLSDQEVADLIAFLKKNDGS